jgi:hypothetical protein
VNWRAGKSARGILVINDCRHLLKFSFFWYLYLCLFPFFLRGPLDGRVWWSSSDLLRAPTDGLSRDILSLCVSYAQPREIQIRIRDFEVETVARRCAGGPRRRAAECWAYSKRIKIRLVWAPHSPVIRQKQEIGNAGSAATCGIWCCMIVVV